MNAVEPRPAQRLRDEAYRHAGALDALREIATRALQHSSYEDFHPIIEIANLARDRQLFAEGDRIYKHLLEYDPRYAFAHYELAISYLLQGRQVDALVSIDRLMEDRPQDHRGALLAARLLQGLGAYDLANQRLCLSAKEYPEDSAFYVEFGEFLKAYPRGVGSHLSATFEGSPRFLDTYGVLRLVRSAIEDRRGFALVRLGDGEGAFMRMPWEEERRFAHLYGRNRADRANVWFAGELDLAASGFLEQALQLSDTIQSADIVGVPYRTWLESEYDILSAITISTLVNALRTVQADAKPDQLFCRQDVHAHMKDTGELGRLLEEQEEIGLISCHAQLPERLKAVFGLKDVEFHKLPGEKLMRAHLGEEAVQGQHFPDVFQSVMRSLERPLQGKLFLVAGGILGKFYCGRIKAQGGVAIDVGSVADAWAGSPTRAGITRESAI